jgi:hypothetical protein
MLANRLTVANFQKVTHHRMLHSVVDALDDVLDSTTPGLHTTRKCTRATNSYQKNVWPINILVPFHN